ncbi:hypothetical protein LINPERPRIM_LOCUS30632, partial [Linum perenne]
STDLPASPHGNQLQNYQPPDSGRRTLLCDGSFTKTTQKAGYGVLLYDVNGNAVNGRAGSFMCRASICAKAKAILHAVTLAKTDVYPVTIYSNCSMVCDALKKPPDSWPWECAAILASIVDLLRDTDWISIQHCNRQFVRKADTVARLPRDNNLLPNWMETFA